MREREAVGEERKRERKKRRLVVIDHLDQDVGVDQSIAQTSDFRIRSCMGRWVGVDGYV